ncbi:MULTISPECIES: ABC transporter ATP-binding protein [Rhodopseudomonas]|uniref:ABC transporter ATP-binding protein n=1 Tax=Rhodopseudomonas TaxID=1073 RepID=UPI000B26802C|nr:MULTISPECIES: ABC transporter ATP-binding protein [Rhodopseudomonas]MDF3813655.1 ABC transporter ATP-binding protein [Rhodopseudomonas sp. BAL398]WOK15991.1 ABC transporter ATP-binding protein [Rhodopseudomonas sp. BAL398]
MSASSTQSSAIKADGLTTAATAEPPSSPGGRRTMMTIRGLRKSFNDTAVYDDFELDLPLGHFISIFGPNGCGKSTLINMVSGLMPMDAGEVLYDGQRISETRISYVFQNYREALFPWLRAIDNIHYPLKVMGVRRAERDRRIEKLLADFEIRIDLNAYPYALSGGQQQTVSIIRALVTEPEVLFLDEPFSALDYEMTISMREQLQKIFMKTKTTMLLVSHDLDEAIELADKVVLLTRRPTRVAEIVDIELPWPRNLDVTTGENFMALKRHCLDRFWQEVKK